MMTLPLAVDPVLVHAAAAAVGAVLILGGISKFKDIPLFEAILDNYRLIPAHLLGAVAVVLPAVEISAGAMLLHSSTRNAGVFLALCVLAVVSAAVLVNILRGRTNIECGCDAGSVPVSRGLLVRNAVLVPLALAAAQTPTERPMVWLDLVSTLTLTLFLLGLYKTVNLWLSHQSRIIALRNAP